VIHFGPSRANRPVPFIMRTNEQIHGHEVMQMMLDSGVTYTRATLRDAILEKFGPEARFFTCSAENMTADGLIDFLAGRGKFVETAGGFTTDPANVCDHESNP
jgi:probable metal-binding protein